MEDAVIISDSRGLLSLLLRRGNQAGEFFIPFLDKKRNTYAFNIDKLNKE